MSTAVAERPRFGAFISNSGVQKLIRNTLSDPKRAQTFCASIISAVTLNKDLAECDFDTILSCALLGESLGLSPSPQLGQYYLVPFNDTKNNRKTATFILGYKGYVQLALRSGQYRKLVVQSIKKGELIRYDEFNEEIEVAPIADPLERDAAETIGYFAMFEYLNGFRKMLYWSREKMFQHATRYSSAFGPAPARGKFPGRVAYDKYLAGEYKKQDEWAYSSFWYKDFDGMAYKTMLRQLISKWGIMSVELRQAFESDDAVISQDLTPDYSSEYESQPPTQTDEPYDGPKYDEPLVDEDTGEITDEQTMLDMATL